MTSSRSVQPFDAGSPTRAQILFSILNDCLDEKQFSN